LGYKTLQEIAQKTAAGRVETANGKQTIISLGNVAEISSQIVNDISHRKGTEHSMETFPSALTLSIRRVCRR